MADIRRYEVHARSTDTFGRVLCGCRNHHFVADGPVQNGCPGEAVTPGEFFLAGVASCGVELVEVIAKEKGAPLAEARVTITGEMDREKPARTDYAVFNSVKLRFDLKGVTPSLARDLVDAFKGR